MSDDTFSIVDLLIKIIPLGLFMGLSTIFLLRWIKSRRNRARERQAQHQTLLSELGNSIEGESKVEPNSHSMILVLIEILLFLYLLFSFDWSPGPGLSPSIGESPGALIIVPIYYALISARFGLAVVFFACLGGSIVMSRYYDGPWPKPFKLACMAVFPLVLAWLTYRWGQTAWSLTSYFPSDLPRGLKDLLITGLFSACGGRHYNYETAMSIGQSTGMFLLEWLAAIYLTEKHFRWSMFHEHHHERGAAWWARFAPALPLMLIVGFIGLGLWGDFQRERTASQMSKMERVVLQPKIPHILWHNAVEQCQTQGEGWRLPTTHELRWLSRGVLATDSQISSAWTSELVPKYGPRDLSWGGKQQYLPSYVPDVLHHCLSSQPNDLYQRIIVKLFPTLYIQNHANNFHRYFYPDSPAEALPVAVLCVKPTEQADSESSSLLVKDAILVKDTKTATDLLKPLCEAKAYASIYCSAADAMQAEAIKDNDSGKLAEDFEARQEKCRLTADPEHCTGQGWYYRIRGEFDKALVFYQASCAKAVSTACLDIEEIKKEQKEFTDAADALVRLGYVAIAPTRHREAKDPMHLACEQGHASLCLYRGRIAEWDNKQDEARRLYQKGCDGGILPSCTKQVVLERTDSMAKDVEAVIIPRFANLCNKKEALACLYLAGMLGDSRRGARAKEGIVLAKQRCAEGMSSLCEFYENSTNPSRWYVPNEMQAEDVRPDSPYDVERLQASCRRNVLNCKGYVERLTNQGQFKDAEWFREQVCIDEKVKDVKLCSQQISWRNRFSNMTQLLMKRRYLASPVADHASMVPVLKQACQDGVKDACLYLGDLMYDVMTERSEGGHAQYTRSGLIKPYEQACQLGDASACKHALDLARQWREGSHYAEKETYPRAPTTDEGQAYAKLCEERHYSGACWEVLVPWIEDKSQDHRQIPEALAPVWRVTERLCEKQHDTVACWTLLKPWINYLEHDHSKLPQDRTPIRRQLERLCGIESEEEDTDKRACRELQRYIDFHWL